MRIMLLGLALTVVLAACGDDDPAREPRADEAPEVEPDPIPGKKPVSKAHLEKAAERLRKQIAAGNRPPGMPNGSMAGDPESAREAARRLQIAQLGVFSEVEIKKFMDATGWLQHAKTEDERVAVFEKHEIAPLRYAMIESLFKRARGTGPSLNEVQKKLVAPWLKAWIKATEKK